MSAGEGYIYCDTPGCPHTIQQRDRETLLELRIRAARDHGWMFTPSLRHGGHTDRCEEHA